MGGGELVGGLGEGESEGKRWVCGNEKNKKINKEMRDLIGICTKFLVTKLDSSLLRTCSDEIGFVTDNVTKNTTSILATTFFRHYFSHSMTKLVLSLIV